MSPIKRMSAPQYSSILPLVENADNQKLTTDQDSYNKYRYFDFLFAHPFSDVLACGFNN